MLRRAAARRRGNAHLVVSGMAHQRRSHLGAPLSAYLRISRRRLALLRRA